MQKTKNDQQVKRMLAGLGLSVVAGVITFAIFIISSFVFTTASLSAFQSAYLSLSFVTAILYVVFSAKSLRYSILREMLRLGRNILVSAVGGFLFTIATQTYYGVNLFTGMDCQPFQNTEGLVVCPHHAFLQGFYFLMTHILPLWSVVAFVSVSVFSLAYARRKQGSKPLIVAPPAAKTF